MVSLLKGGILSLTCMGCLLQTPSEQTDMIVVLSFDDAHHTIYDRAWPCMQAMDSSWRGSHFFPITTLGLENHMTLEQVQNMEEAGWENGGHGIGHENLSTIPLDSAYQQIDSVIHWFTENHLDLHSWAFAYGNYNDDLIAYLKRAGIHNLRTSHDLTYLGTINPAHLGYFAVRQEQSLTDIVNRIDEADEMGSRLLILGFHVILDEEEAEVPFYFTRTSIFQGVLQYIKKREYQVLTLHEAVQKL